ncbi:MAG TPA: 50S ribosomal protein L10 [Methanoregulaceae archaeon]|nr:50S ribosomal protein L10 [Methanoregulaceae archaeon]HQJ87079.1 50S ribosomal protein L10 [Methanoregulaceae archaeon]
MALYTHHLPDWKRREVEEIKQATGGYSLVGLVDMYGIPAAQLQQIRRNLRGIAVIRMARNTLMHHAFAELGGEFEQVRKYINGNSALIYSNENPFRLFKLLEQNKTKMAAKAGQAAPEDIVVEKGPTSFKPGPIVGELQQAGIPAGIEGGKVRIKETKTVVKKGAIINARQADVLAKLGIKPMDVGLVLQVAFYQGSAFEPDVLNIDEQAILDQIGLAATQAFNLSVNAAIPTAETIGAILARAEREARSLGVEAPVYAKEIVGAIIGKAYRETAAVRTAVGEY